MVDVEAGDGEAGAADAHAAAAGQYRRRPFGRQLQHADVRPSGPMYDRLQAAGSELRQNEAGHVLALALRSLARGHGDGKDDF